MNWTSGAYRVTTERKQFDDVAIHAYLTTSYWSPGVPLDVVKRALDHSVCFGLFQGDAQVGLARAVTDRATFAYLADVYVLDDHRGQGLGKFIMTCVLDHPDLKSLRRMMLGTKDAHGLYANYGFTPLKTPARFMERHDPDVYR